MLVYGNAYMEISYTINQMPFGVVIDGFKIWSPKNMYIDIDEHGEVIGYNQAHKGSKPIRFSIDKIVHFKFNSIGDSPYGLSIIEPMRKVLNIKIQMEHDASRLVTKKAGCPIHVQMGGEIAGQPVIPTQTDISNMMSDLDTLENRNNFATSNLVKMIPLTFDLGKEMPYLEHFDRQLVYGLQVPEVLLGTGSIPEGLANVQMESFLFRVQAIQDILDEMISEKILKKYLEYSGMKGNDFDFVWGAPEFKKDKDLTTLKDMLGAGLSETTKTDVENRIRSLLGFKGDILPIQRPIQLPPMMGFGQPQFQSGTIDVKESGMTIKEYTLCEYSSFIDWILKFIEGFNYKDNIQSLDKRKENLFKETLMDAFIKGLGIKQIETAITPFLKDERMAELIAKTEVVRASNEGMLSQWKEQRGVERVKFVTAPVDSVCEICKKLDGKEFTMSEAHNLIPNKTHPRCRCRFTPVI
jgi:SPP1 gp7 family putative phage head morphogenesis protein